MERDIRVVSGRYVEVREGRQTDLTVCANFNCQKPIFEDSRDLIVSRIGKVFFHNDCFPKPVSSPEGSFPFRQDNLLQLHNLFTLARREDRSCVVPAIESAIAYIYRDDPLYHVPSAQLIWNNLNLHYPELQNGGVPHKDTWQFLTTHFEKRGIQFKAITMTDDGVTMYGSPPDRDIFNRADNNVLNVAGFTPPFTLLLHKVGNLDSSHIITMDGGTDSKEDLTDYLENRGNEIVTVLQYGKK